MAVRIYRKDNSLKENRNYGVKKTKKFDNYKLDEKDDDEHFQGLIMIDYKIHFKY